MKANLADAKSASTNLTWLYFYLHSSMRVFCTLFICLALDGLLQSICFRMFCSKHSITFGNTYLLCCWLHCVAVLTYFTSNLDYRISSNKRRASNKRRTFGYPHWNKHLPLISASPLISVAPLNAALIRIVTIFY